MMQVFGIGQIAAHCGSLKKPMHSVHFAGSIANAKLCSEIASFGHSLMHAEHPMQRDSLIIIAIVSLLSQMLICALMLSARPGGYPHHRAVYDESPLSERVPDIL
jgi:threonine/homoserine/homoserine lactone efflux protein